MYVLEHEKEKLRALRSEIERQRDQIKSLEKEMYVTSPLLSAFAAAIVPSISFDFTCLCEKMYETNQLYT